MGLGPKVRYMRPLPGVRGVQDESSDEGGVPPQGFPNGSDAAVADPQILFNRRTFTLARHQSLVGRSPRCSIVLTSRLASREHCILECGSEGLTLIELGSRNGTWVNEERVLRRRTLGHGDQIRVGTDRLQVVERNEPQVLTGRETQRMEPLPMSESRGGGPHGNAPGYTSVLELSEVLIETAGSPEQRPQTTQAVMAAVDELLDQAGFSRPYLTKEETERLSTIVATVLSWWPDGSMKSWHRSLDSRIRAAARPATQAL